MNKKIMMSVFVIVAAAAVVIGGTSAFFSDTETSTGNTFTAGAIDLKVDSQQHYNGHLCVLNPSDSPQVSGDEFVWGPGSNPFPVTGTPCDGTWSETDLGAQTFFSFADVKPGDSGENTISLHVINNDAYACVDVNITKNDDVSSTEPELAVDAPENALNLFDGELAQNLNFFAWADDGATDGFQGTATDPTEGDNVWQVGERPLFSNTVGPASDVLGGKTYTLANSITGPLVGGSTSYIGLAWCAGGMTAVDGVITCDNTSMGNNTQTDSLVASVAFRVVQARNNGQFTCGEFSQQPQIVEPVNLSSAEGFVILAGTAVTSTGTTSVTGNVGISTAGGGAAITGLSCTQTSGTIYDTDAGYTGGFNSNTLCKVTDSTLVGNAVGAMGAAYTDANSRPVNVTNAGTGSGTWDIAGLSLAPGVYKFNGPGNVIISNDVTLTGSASDVWIFQVPGTLNISANKKILLGGAAQAKNIIWAVAGTTTLQAGSTFEGTILGGPGASTIAGQNGAVLHGRALGQKDVTLIGNTVSLP